MNQEGSGTDNETEFLAMSVAQQKKLLLLVVVVDAVSLTYNPRAPANDIYKYLVSLISEF